MRQGLYETARWKPIKMQTGGDTELKKRIVSFALAAMLGVFSFMPILDVRAEPETVGKETLRYEAEVIRKDFAGDFQIYAQFEPTEDYPEDWRTYSIGRPFREYEA